MGADAIARVNPPKRIVPDDLQPNQSSGGGGEGGAFVNVHIGTFFAEFADYIEVDTGQGTINVAKPPNLRGDVGVRFVNGQRQAIFPGYTDGNNVPQGSTDIYYAELEVGTDRDGDGIVSTGTGVASAPRYFDLNVDGRMWAVT
jgi:hypothetical protein